MLLDGWSVEEVREAMEGLEPEEQVELFTLISAPGKDLWYSLPGPQSDARYSEADILGYGGSAGGGKTDLLCGLALVDHQTATIFRNEVTQLEPVKERIEGILGSRQGFNGQTNIWRLRKGNALRRIRFGGFPNPGDEKRYQGSPNDLVAFDEAAEMREAAVRFVIGWNRSAKRNQRTRIILTFNPPTTPEGRWIISYFAPWLDKRFSGPGGRAMPGELRWATTGPDGKDYWLLDGREFVWEAGKPVFDFVRSEYKKEQIVRPMSRTFIPARLTDNPFLSGGEYLSRLQNFPEPLRSQMLYGDFEAGMEDDKWQVIPTEWVRLSMERWRAQGSLNPAFRKPGIMTSMGVDPAMGGRDKFVIARRHGRWFDDMIRWPGKSVPNGAVGAGRVIEARRDRAPVHVDIVGWGADTHGALVGNGVQTIAINGANSSHVTTEVGQRFVNKRAELVWAMREALDPAKPDCVNLPDDTELELDLTAYRWRYTRSGIQIESKEEMIKRLGHSPDAGDACCYALVDTVPDDVLIDAVAELGHGAETWDRMAI